ncbi:hypothetical protein F5Y06DRAFT_303479 [Hypoxylon sp. FL0890]|nr:hypothetical protein F5Y06DRAFT_303479 [Hypoxylon sp. FL0890]
MKQQEAGYLSPELINEFKKVYADKKSAISEHVTKVKQILENGAKSGAFRAIPISTRMKEFDSALSSLHRRQAVRFEREELRKRMLAYGGDWERYWTDRGKEWMINDWGPFENHEVMVDALHDFGGARVCVYFPDDIQKVVSFIEQCALLRIVPVTRKTRGSKDMADLRKYVQNLEDQASTSKPNPPNLGNDSSTNERPFGGYRAKHIVVELLGDAVPEWHKGSHYRVEIQITTVLMHAWSQIDHELIYKPGGNKPSIEEIRTLELLNGIVLIGEAALKQLAACTARKEKNGPRGEDVGTSQRLDIGAAKGYYTFKVGRCSFTVRNLGETLDLTVEVPPRSLL